MQGDCKDIYDKRCWHPSPPQYCIVIVTTLGLCEGANVVAIVGREYKDHTIGGLLTGDKGTCLYIANAMQNAIISHCKPRS